MPQLNSKNTEIYSPSLDLKIQAFIPDCWL